MNILILGKDYPDGFARLITDELVRMGHAAELIDPGPRTGWRPTHLGRQLEKAKNHFWNAYALTPGGEQAWRRRIEAGAARHRSLDLMICCHDFLTPGTAQHLKSATGAPLVLWYPDAISNFGRHMFLNAGYDALFFKDPHIVRSLKRTLRADCYYLPEAFCPESLAPVEMTSADLASYGCDIATAGNLYAYRIAFFGQLSEFDVRIWGNPPARWADTGSIRRMIQDRYLTGADKVKAFRAAKIVLNNLHPAEIDGINARAFEIAGAGGFQMVDRRAALPQLFDLDKEVVAFDDLEDLQRKIRRYLSADAERADIAAAGRRRAVAEHTYRHRLELMLTTIFKGGAGYAMPTSPPFGAH